MREDAPVRDRLLAALERARGSWVSHADLLQAMYGDRADGGPDQASNVLTTLVSKLRTLGVVVEQTSAYRLPPRR